MKQIFTVLATCATLLLASCAKEKSIDSLDPDGPDQPGNENQGLLIRGVLMDGNDSMITVFGYDAQKRLISQSVTATDANFINEEFEITRNSSGQIVQYEYSSSEYIGIGIGSVVFKVAYDAGKNQYTHKTMEYESQGNIVKDSIAYTYDNQNRIIKEEEFMRDPVTETYIKVNITDYSYNSSGDLEKMLSYYYDIGIGDFNLFYDATYQYDAKLNPLILGNEAIVLSLHTLYGTHNVAKETTVYPDDPENDRNLSVDFTYNADGKPVSSTITEVTSGESFTYKYYYR